MLMSISSARRGGGRLSIWPVQSLRGCRGYASRAGGGIDLRTGQAKSNRGGLRSPIQCSGCWIVTDIEYELKARRARADRLPRRSAYRRRNGGECIDRTRGWNVNHATRADKVENQLEDDRRRRAKFADVYPFESLEKAICDGCAAHWIRLIRRSIR